MRTLLVTGAAGFIGANFVHYWLAQHPGDRVVVLDALTFKCAVLWSMLDALDYAYVVPGRIPPGAFTPDAS